MAYTSVDDPTIYFNTVTYSGNSSNNRTISGFGFNPDWVWVKCRTSAFSNTTADSVRGTNANLFINETGAEINPTSDIGRGGIGQVTTDGFIAVQGSSSMDNTNTSGQNYVSWCWKAAGSTATNTEGNVNTTISANPTAGFSIISADPGSTSGELTLGHGLGTVPTMMIWKNRETDGQNWQVFHQATGTALMILNSDAAKNTDVTFWNTHTTTLFKMTTHMYAQNKDFIGYCFSDRQGYSKFGSYVGNGNVDGTFLHLGFRPAFTMIRSTGSDKWNMFDAKRNPFNEVDNNLRANTNGAEVDQANKEVDYLSNGVKLRTSSGEWNTSGTTYIYMAFAESPFVNSSGVPNNAR
jgi:hypothetical protein